MARRIPQADVELAETLVAANRPTDQIITALAYRGLDSSTAARLVSDLQKALFPRKSAFPSTHATLSD